jgi:hypothetical protein
MRIGFVRPLGVQFKVMDDVRTVIVYDSTFPHSNSKKTRSRREPREA